MKIMIIAASSLPIPAYKGGATETLVTNLLNKLEDIGESDLHIDVYSHCYGVNYEKRISAYHFLPKIWIEYVYQFVMRIVRLILLRKIYIPDIFPIVMRKKYKVDFSNYDIVLLEGCMQQVGTLRKVYNGTVGLHIHTVMTLTPNTNGGKSVCKKCDYLIGNSDYCSSVLKSISYENRDKIRTIKNCILLDQFKEEDKEFINNFKRKNSIDIDEKCIIYCGRLERGKGVLELIKAFEKASIKGRLIVVGSSWFSDNKKTKYVKQLERAAEAIKDRIIFTGYVRHSEIQKYYHCADFCIMPSIYDEAAGLVALEAQASGIPVVISDRGGISEFVHPKTELIVRYNGMFIDRLSDIIKRLATDESLYNREVKRLKDNIIQFDMDRYADLFMGFINELETSNR